MEIGKEILTEGFGLKDIHEFHDFLEKEEEWIAQYQNPEFFLVAEMDGQVAGFLHFDRGKLISTQHQGTFGLSVEKNARGKGVGRKLALAMIDRCENQREIDIIRLTVFASNIRAIHLYESLGFQHEGKLVGYIRKGSFRDDLIYMALHLS